MAKKHPYPPVRDYGDIERESFDSYYGRWPQELSNIPKPVVEDWIHRHWNCFEERWSALAPHKWEYHLETFSNDRILAIDHVLTWIQDLDAEGVEYVTDKPRAQTRLARFMLEHGTFPVPIIVAQDASHLIAPGSGGEHMKAPLHLIEGHSRLACIRGMINSSYPTLKPQHSVWVVKIPK